MTLLSGKAIRSDGRLSLPWGGCSVLDDYIYTDQEVSGTIGQRPAYKRLLAAAKAHKFDAVLVESHDRLWRDQGEMHDALKRLRFWGIKVYSLATRTDLTDKAGKLMASVMGWKDEAFIEGLRDKTRRGMLGQFRRGFSAGGRAYGYRSEPMYDASGQIVGSHRVIDPEESRVIRRIFKLYAGGMSPQDHRPAPQRQKRPSAAYLARSSPSRMDMDHYQRLAQEGIRHLE